MPVYVWETNVCVCGGEGEGIVIAGCVLVCAGRQGQPVWDEAEGGCVLWQMEAAGPTERPSIVWPTSASL